MTLVRTKWNLGNSMRSEKENNRILYMCCQSQQGKQQNSKEVLFEETNHRVILSWSFKEVPLGLSHLWPLTYTYNGEEFELDLRNPGQWPWLHRQLALCPWEKFFTLLYHLCELLWRSSEKTWRHSPSHSFLHSSPDFLLHHGCDSYADSFTVCQRKSGLYYASPPSPGFPGAQWTPWTFTSDLVLVSWCISLPDSKLSQGTKHARLYT